MAKLEKLVIQGFKSFKKRVSIPLPVGFSVITGPNGSGKSCLADAVSFVLGDRSRAMRVKRAQDLIFHGSKAKSGSEYASAILYFSNEKKELPFEEKTVSISRRINKNGVSTYRLNGKVVTRQQVLDIFSLVGVQPDGHNIIQQGDVNQIVEMDAIQRRQILDEVSGIQEFDDKKQKALKELDKIGEKVKEAEIILSEKEGIIDKLRAERDAAVEFRQLESDLKKIRLSILWKDYSTREKDLSKTGQTLEGKEEEIKTLEKEIQELDSQLDREQQALEDLTKTVFQASTQIEVSKNVSRLEAEIEAKQESIESKRAEIQRIEDLISSVRSLGRPAPSELKDILKFNGVHGMLSDLVEVPRKYTTAVQVAAGGHLSDIIVNRADTAVQCVKHLKQKRAGRARFLPLDKIKGRPKKPLPPGSIGWLSDLIKFDSKNSPAMEFVFGSTLCVQDIDTAKSIFNKSRVRIVTLDGDLIEASGSITGGFFKKKDDFSKYDVAKKNLESQIQSLESSLSSMQTKLGELREQDKPLSFGLEKQKTALDEKIAKIRTKRKESFERKLIAEQDINRLNIHKAKVEAKFEDLKTQWDTDQKETEELQPFIDLQVSTLRQKERESLERMNEIGLVNLKAIDDFETLKEEFDIFKERVGKITSEKRSIEDTIQKIEERRLEVFNTTLREISKYFKQVYTELTKGDAELSLEDPHNIESGLLIKASPPGKKLLSIDSMSGGEKTLTSFAFLFAIQRHKPTPFYILDEADATLDKTNTKRIANLIKANSDNAQFLVISHNDHMIRGADQVYGVSMEEGESKIIAVHLPSDAKTKKESEPENEKEPEEQEQEEPLVEEVVQDSKNN